MQVEGDIHHSRVLILDFGSQYTQLIARRVREERVYSEVHSCDLPDEAISTFRPSAIILSGGPESVLDQSYQLPPAIFTTGVPVLGICYGMQLIAQQLGGEVTAGSGREYGYAEVRARGHSELLRGIQDRSNAEGHGLLRVWMSHGDQVTTLPPGFQCIASSESGIAAMADEKRHLYGLQFHPEVTHTPQGSAILRRFLHDIAGCEKCWNMEAVVADSVRHIREQVGSGQVLLALSGGVDSSVLAALLRKAIGEQLHCIFVDTGLLRLHEAEQLMQTFVTEMDLEVKKVDAAEDFLQALAGVSDAERKRHIIGHEFIRIFEQQAQEYDDCEWLAQGTIYPDVVESAGAATGKAQVIKSHHNVGGLPETMQMKLLEPLRELFKDEVRQLGKELGVPNIISRRHPFPGPGLAVRISGEVRAEYLQRLRLADDIFLQELEAAGLYDEVSQAFAVFLPVRAVGVMGDARRYDHVIVLRAVSTIDFMTAHKVELPWQCLSRAASRILNEVAGISRVCYDISDKPPATIEWE